MKAPACSGRGVGWDGVGCISEMLGKRMALACGQRMILPAFCLPVQAAPHQLKPAALAHLLVQRFQRCSGLLRLSLGRLPLLLLLRQRLSGQAGRGRFQVHR